MAMSIKNAEIESLAREIAGRRNISLTEAVRVSLQREAARDRVLPRNDNLAKLELLRNISMEAAALPVISDASEDEILGYDENGIPTQ
jgi:antitoxin VapB